MTLHPSTPKPNRIRYRPASRTDAVDTGERIGTIVIALAGRSSAMSLPPTMPRPTTTHRRTRRHDRRQCRRAFIACGPAGLSPAVIGVRVTGARAGHQRGRIDVVAVVRVDDYGGGGVGDGDGPGADAELGLVAVAGDPHPEVEVRLGFRTAGLAYVLDGKVFLESLFYFYFW